MMATCASVRRIAHLLDAAQRRVLRLGGFDHLVQQIADHLVAQRGDADLAAGAHERGDHACARVGLAGAGRALDRQDAVVERLDPAARGAKRVVASGDLPVRGRGGRRSRSRGRRGRAPAHRCRARRPSARAASAHRASPGPRISVCLKTELRCSAATDGPFLMSIVQRATSIASTLAKRFRRHAACRPRGSRIPAAGRRSGRRRSAPAWRRARRTPVRRAPPSPPSSSSSDRPRRRKYSHHVAFFSRRCQSSMLASSQRACCSGSRSFGSGERSPASRWSAPRRGAAARRRSRSDRLPAAPAARSPAPGRRGPGAGPPASREAAWSRCSRRGCRPRPRAGLSGTASFLPSSTARSSARR